MEQGGERSCSLGRTNVGETTQDQFDELMLVQSELGVLCSAIMMELQTKEVSGVSGGCDFEVVMDPVFEVIH